LRIFLFPATSFARNPLMPVWRIMLETGQAVCYNLATTKEGGSAALRSLPQICEITQYRGDHGKVEEKN
jgi:hypothetical protein